MGEIQSGKPDRIDLQRRIHSVEQYKIQGAVSH
jgi:hypothetical protein